MAYGANGKVELESIESVTNLENIENVENVETVASVTNVANVTNVATVAAVTNVNNVSTVASVTNVGTVSNVSTVASVTNVATVDKIGKYQATKPTIADGNTGTLQQGSRGSLCVELRAPDSANALRTDNTNGATISSSTNTFLSAVTFPYTYDPQSGLWSREKAPVSFTPANISTNTTTTVKSGAGVLHSIVVLNPGTAATISLFDSLSGSGTSLGVLGGLLAPITLLMDIKFATGLTIVTTGTPNLTVAFR